MIKKIRQQLAHIFAAYGDQPDELLYMFETLVLEWHSKGLKTNKGIKLLCPHCNFAITVYHMEWTAIICPECKGQINH